MMIGSLLLKCIKPSCESNYYGLLEQIKSYISFIIHSSKQKMLSFPEWLKPIRRHSATSLISSSSMVTQPGTNKDLRYGIHPAFHHQNVTSYNNSSQIMNQFNLIESNSDMKSISNKHSKSPWGRVRICYNQFIIVLYFT